MESVLTGFVMSLIQTRSGSGYKNNVTATRNYSSTKKSPDTVMKPTFVRLTR
jgi:hypothetical protein